MSKELLNHLDASDIVQSLSIVASAKGTQLISYNNSLVAIPYIYLEKLHEVLESNKDLDLNSKEGRETMKLMMDPEFDLLIATDKNPVDDEGEYLDAMKSVCLSEIDRLFSISDTQSPQENLMSFVLNYTSS